MSFQAAPMLPLKDVHPGLVPTWWPPAPGWWLLFGAVVLVAFGLWRWQHVRRRRINALARYYDDTLAQAATPVARVAAISELLRRAARRIDPQADRLEGDDWLRFLDTGLKQPVFLHGPGELLRDGVYRPDVDPAAMEALRVVARQRYLDWMRRA